MTTPKNGRPRRIPLAPSVLAAPKATGKLVFCAVDGRMLTRNECKHPVWRACRWAGLRQVGWHMLRHTFASHLVMRGAPIEAVQEVLGHASIEMTMRYAHLLPDARKDAVGLVDLATSPGTGHTSPPSPGRITDAIYDNLMATTENEPQPPKTSVEAPGTAPLPAVLREPERDGTLADNPR